MTPPELQGYDTVEALARAQGLDLPAARLATLAGTFADFMAKFDDIWQIEPGDHEPPAITFDDEAHS
jgi:hypothetical protein